MIGRWLPWPQLITYVLGGIGAALVPAFPHIELDPGFFFLCFLPPLLFADGWLMPLREFLRAKRPILLLAIGLVAFTTVAVGLMTHWLIPSLPLAMCFALGAIVSPTDAVAVNAVTEHLRIPARMSTILNGESLMNDATGLVAFKFALIAVAAGGSFNFARLPVDFAIIALGGCAVGFGVSYGIGQLQDLLRRVGVSDSVISITLSLMTPFAAYMTAEKLHVSGVLSVVLAGLYAGWRDPVRLDVETRQSAYAVWDLLIFWLNGIAFVLLGLQVPKLFAAVSGHYTTAQLLGLTVGVSGVAMAARLLWVYPGTYLPYIFPSVRRSETAPSIRGVTVVGWAGMRGTVTLAAALSIPLTLEDGSPFPGRNIVIFLAFGVIATTLLVQGTTLEWLIKRFGIREGDERSQEERLARIAAVEAGLNSLRVNEAAATNPDDAAALGRVVGEYETRLAALTAEGETRGSARRRRRHEHRYRTLALKAERQAVNHLWRTGVIADEVHRPLIQLLDHEEAMLHASPPPTDD